MRQLIFIFFLNIGIVGFAQTNDLNFFIEQATMHSPLIQQNNAANALLDLNQQQIERILTSPEINLESNILFAPIISHDNGKSQFQFVSPAATNYTGYDQANTDGGQYQAYLSIKQPVFNGRSLKAYGYKNDILHRMNQNKITLTIHEIEQLIGYQYILCMKSKVQVANSDSVLKQFDDQINLMQKLVQHGIYKQTDLMLLQIEYQNRVLENKTFRDEFRTNLYDLKLLSGINDPNVSDIKLIDIQQKNKPFVNSAFLTSFRLDSLNILADRSLTELKYKPQLNLFANAGMNAIYLPSVNRLGFSLGLNFAWNIYDGGQRKLENEKLKINLRTSQFEKDYFLKQKEVNLQKIQSQLVNLMERITEIESQLNQYNILLDTYKNELLQGQISIMDFKNLLKDITSKKQAKILLQMEKQVLVNAYNYWDY
jgi:hypothetical protein